MSLLNKINLGIRESMKKKNVVELETLRSIKSALLHEKTRCISTDISVGDEMIILQKLHKQRKDLAALYQKKGNMDLYEKEENQARVIEKFLPKNLELEDILKEVENAIRAVGATSVKDMGRTMNYITQKFRGTSQVKLFASVVKEQLLKNSK